MWVIENLDDVGEGMLIVDVPTKAEALKIHAEKNAGAKITSIEKVKWVDLALVTGERGEAYYFNRGGAMSEKTLNEQIAERLKWLIKNTSIDFASDAVEREILPLLEAADAFDKSVKEDSPEVWEARKTLWAAQRAASGVKG